MAEADPVALGIAHVERPPGAMDDLDLVPGEVFLDFSAIRGSDPEREQVPARPGIPEVRMDRRLLRFLQSEEAATGEPHPHATERPIRAQVALEDLEAQDVTVEGNGSLRIPELHGEVMEPEGLHAPDAMIPPAPWRAC